MKVLIACEFSDTVGSAFRAKGHQVVSADLFPSEGNGTHYQGDVLDIINDGWDMLIGFPPCIYLSYAATAYWDRPGRIKKRLDALEFFRQLWEAPIDKICIENPLGIASAVITQHHQVIEPYYFGESAKKRTCLWLKNLPPLVHYEQDNLFGQKTHAPKPQPVYIDKSGKKRHLTESLSGSKGNKKRTRFWKGIATAMADQWG